MYKFMRVAFWTALLGAVVMAALPHPPTTIEIGDKYQHMLAFGTLAVLAILAYPATPLGRIAERLSFLGAMIEVVQSIPALHRDCDILDWVADTAVVLAVVAMVVLYRGLAQRAEQREACP
jgi:VanZ family protein